ncbi:MAG: hypothetical protein J6568_03565 [Snodgrassella sp.]|nr:hypothetical protein [Snodgrassella sp.]
MDIYRLSDQTNASACIGLIVVFNSNHYCIGIMDNRFQFSGLALIIGVLSAIFLNPAIKPLPHNNIDLLAGF